MTTGAHPDWQPCRVVEAVPVSTRARRITLERPVGSGRPADPGSHVDVRVPLETGDVVRSYSVVESDPTGRRITVTVALAARSRGGSTYLHGLQVGDTVSATRPLSDFPLVLGADRYVLLAGGIGITALIGAARTLARAGADHCLVYVGRSRAEMAYVEDLAAEHGDRLELHVGDEGTPLDVEALVAEVAAAPGRTELIVCGPVRLLDAVRAAWAAAGRPATDLRFETFGTSGRFDAEPFEICAPEHGVSVTVAPEQSALDALVAAGVPVMWDCRKGECGLCLMAVTAVDGELDHRDVFLSDAEKAAGARACLCVARVVGRPAGTGRVVVRTP